MERLIVILVALLLAIGGLTYYNLYYPPSQLRHATQKALDNFADAAATKDRAKVGSALKDHMTDTAKLHLEVTTFAFAQTSGKPDIEDFDKPAFLSFVDNILYSLSDYSFHGELQQFKLSADRTSADVGFIVDAWGDGNEYFSGSAVNMRFVTNTECTGRVTFENKRALLDTMNCKMRLRSAPKPGEERKLQSPEAIRQMLK